MLLAHFLSSWTSHGSESGMPRCKHSAREYPLQLVACRSAPGLACQFLLWPRIRPTRCLPHRTKSDLLGFWRSPFWVCFFSHGPKKVDPLFLGPHPTELLTGNKELVWGSGVSGGGYHCLICTSVSFQQPETELTSQTGLKPHARDFIARRKEELQHGSITCK